MNKLFMLSCLFLALISTSMGQSNVEKTISISNQKNLTIQALYSSITIKTWDKNEINIDGLVMINGKEDTDPFDLMIDKSTDRINIETYIDVDIIDNFKSSKENNRKRIFNNNSNCNNKIESELSITIPKSMSLNIESTYGGIFLEEVSKSMKINNTYGPIEVSIGDINSVDKIDLHSIYSSVDLSLSPEAKANIEINTGFGQIYTDMELDKTHALR